MIINTRQPYINKGISLTEVIPFVLLNMPSFSTRGQQIECKI
jgi:hypothetical protein